MSLSNVPNPCLLAVMLTVSTHSGPQFVYHYPPVPSAKPPSHDSDHDMFSGEDSSDSTVSYDSDDERAIEDGEEERSDKLGVHFKLDGSRRKRRNNSMRRLSAVSGSSVGEALAGAPDRILADDKKGPTATGPDALTHVLGFDTDFLSELLTPQRAMCNRKFEMNIDDLVYLGIPVHVQPDGSWRKRKQARTHRSEHTDDPATRHNSTDANANAHGSAHADVNGSGPSGGSADRQDGVADGPGPADGPSTASQHTDPNSPMRIFHVVFVMNPPAIEYGYRAEQMFQFVLSKFVSTLRTEQAKSNYVWNEVSTILHVRERGLLDKRPADDVYAEMHERSSLALALKQLYEAISTSRIASVRLNKAVRAFQIPIDYEYERLPAITESYLPGSYLSSVGSRAADGAAGEDHDESASAILLLEEPDTIIRQIDVDSRGAIAAFVRSIVPTASIRQLAALTGTGLDVVLELVRSLVYWRRARLIVPLHHRDVFAVSPLASISRLHEFVGPFRERFPALPPLHRFLSMLSSGRPRPFVTHIPSRDHQEVYMAALAWLLREGFVMPLHTFAWVKISRRIRLAVASELHENDLARELGAVDLSERRKNVTDTSVDNTSKGRSSSNTQQQARSADTTGSRPSLDGNAPPSAPSADDDYQDTLLLDPGHATLLQKKWLAKLTDGKPSEVVALFNRMLKHLNGRHALEWYLPIEGLTRQDLRRVLKTFPDDIVVTRHW